MGTASLLVIASLAACSPAGGRSAAERTAAAFAAALAAHDGRAACSLLIESTRESVETGSGKPCAEGVLDAKSSTGSATARVWDDEAEVRQGTDTLFLDRTTSGWRVRAAGCTRAPADRPYDCEVAP